MNTPCTAVIDFARTTKQRLPTMFEPAQWMKAGHEESVVFSGSCMHACRFFNRVAVGF